MGYIYSYAVYSYGVYSYGVYTYGLYSYGLYSYGLYGDILASIRNEVSDGAARGNPTPSPQKQSTAFVQAYTSRACAGCPAAHHGQAALQHLYVLGCCCTRRSGSSLHWLVVNGARSSYRAPKTNPGGSHRWGRPSSDAQQNLPGYSTWCSKPSSMSLNSHGALFYCRCKKHFFPVAIKKTKTSQGVGCLQTVGQIFAK